MSSYGKFAKSLTELQKIGQRTPRLYIKGRPYEVDIELMVERSGIAIDAIPLADKGIEGWISISTKMLYVDIDLADGRERRYRFTVAEEFAHSILHADIFRDVETRDEWIKTWNGLPADLYRQLDQQAKELGGILLMPEDKFIPRMLEVRDNMYSLLGTKTPSLEQKAHIATTIIKTLMDDFNVNEQPCRIRFQRLTKFNPLFPD